jgi:short-subunit dehydrogenase
MASLKQTVLVTGATSGIGLELSKLFAKNNYNLVLVARDEFTLNEIAEQLRKTGSGKIMVISKDLSLHHAAEELYLEVTMAGIHIDILVNDAGSGQHGKFSEIPPEKDLEIIHLNIISLVILTKLFLKDMLENGNDRIMQLASVASYQPTPLLAVYAATKAFVLSLTDSLVNELEGTGVTVTALIPGPTETDFFHKADMENTRAARHAPEDAAVVAKIGYEALMHGKHHATAHGVKKQIVKSAVLPNDNVAASARRQMEEPEE